MLSFSLHSLQCNIACELLLLVPLAKYSSETGIIYVYLKHFQFRTDSMRDDVLSVMRLQMPAFVAALPFSLAMLSISHPHLIRFDVHLFYSIALATQICVSVIGFVVIIVRRVSHFHSAECSVHLLLFFALFIWSMMPHTHTAIRFVFRCVVLSIYHLSLSLFLAFILSPPSR